MRRDIRMLAMAGAGALAVLALSGCDAFNKGFNKGFNESFDKQIKAGCMKTASEKASADVADKYCSCVVTELDKLPTEEKMSLNSHPEVQQKVADTCNAQMSATTSDSNDTSTTTTTTTTTNSVSSGSSSPSQ